MADKEPKDTLVLVTGASGYVASHVVHNLLKKGFKVRGTVRSLKNAAKIDPIRKLDVDGRLELVEADLLKEEGWASAVAGCDFVQHVASPFPIVADETVVTTAIAGTVNVLKAVAKCHSVQKVVLTSSCVAVSEGHDQTRSFSEADWTNLEDPRTGLYPRSKTMAEKEAWKFLAEIPEGDNKFRLSTINPVLVIGPPLIDEQGSSISIIRQFLQHEMPMCPPMQLALVDVRDVAEMHVKAMLSKEADNERFLAASQPSYWFRDISRVLGKEFNDHGYCTPRYQAPGFIVRMMAIFDKQAASIVDRLHHEIKFDNSKAQRILGINFRNPDESLIEMGYVCIERGIVKRNKNYKGCPEKYNEFVDKK
ncbi:hypothetical protein PFISCL1PPCAC_22462 [Pristionchus fissidentatus]|uniref:NAD-dependent epimerase/dehydratase domain-containing protein n=1 Tax=Pristionchus fissidentatus TaxID=1538716 RepID=A0AAV5WKU6_9BILA|nr:hypothetical protein PFISCL1PPCAC_22462 [Pristionchus fissidentatus]